MRVLHSAALAASLLLLTSAASAQSLGEAAAKEKQRKKGQTAPAKVYTEDDLRSAGHGGTYSAPSSAAAPEAAPAKAESAKGEESGEGKEQEKTEDELRTEQETAWRQKLDDATKEVAHYQDQVRQVQLDLNDTSGGVFTPRRAALQTRLEETQKLLASAQEKLVALQDEGRRNRFR